jgi:hypothetical protein
LLSSVAHVALIRPGGRDNRMHDQSGAALQTWPVPEPDSLGSTRGNLPAALADAIGVVDCGRRLSRVALAARIHCGHVPDAQRRLLL